MYFKIREDRRKTARGD
ncbi:hypothetical protein ACVQYG_005617 [Escherichia coli]